MSLPDILIKDIEVEFLRQLTKILKEGKIDRLAAKTTSQTFILLHLQELKI